MRVVFIPRPQRTDSTLHVVSRPRARKYRVRPIHGGKKPLAEGITFKNRTRRSAYERFSFYPFTACTVETTLRAVVYEKNRHRSTLKDFEKCFEFDREWM